MTNVSKRGFKRVLSLAAIAMIGVMLTACAGGMNSNIKAAATQPLPPAINDPAAATFQWQPTMNFLVRVHTGFDDKTWKLLPDGPATFKESSAVAQISGRCAADIQASLRNTSWLEMRRAVQTGGSQALGSLLGTRIGFMNPTQAIYKQVVGLTFGTALGGGYDAIDMQIGMVLSAGHAQCVRDTVDRVPELNRIIIVMMPMLSFKPPVVLAPNQDEPDDDKLRAMSSVTSYQDQKPAKPKKK